MATVDDLRKYALSLPEVIEGGHFHMVAFRVADMPFAGVEKGHTHALLSLGEHDIHTLVAEDPKVFEEIWQNKKRLVGVRIDLAKITRKRLKQLIEQSWRHKAPKRLVVGYDAR